MKCSSLHYHRHTCSEDANVVHLTNCFFPRKYITIAYSESYKICERIIENLLFWGSLLHIFQQPSASPRSPVFHLPLRLSTGRPGARSWPVKSRAPRGPAKVRVNGLPDDAEFSRSNNAISRRRAPPASRSADHQPPPHYCNQITRFHPRNKIQQSNRDFSLRSSATAARGAARAKNAVHKFGADGAVPGFGKNFGRFLCGGKSKVG